MKRLVSFAIALLLCGCLIVCFTITAYARTKSVTLTAKTVERATVGDIIPVDISISNGSALGALEFQVSGDASYFNAVSFYDSRGRKQWFTEGSASGGSIVCSEDKYASAGLLKFACANANGYWNAGVFVTVYFKIKATLPQSGALIKLAVNATTHYEDNTVNYNVGVVNARVKPKTVSSIPSIPSSSVEPPSSYNSHASSSRQSASSKRAAVSKVVSSKRSPLSVPVSSTPSVSSTVTSVPAVPHVIETESLIPMESAVSLPVYEQEISTTPASSEADSGTQFESIGWLLVLIVAAVLLVPLAVFVIIFSCIKLKSSNNK